jgi:hypothetical protein
VVLVFNAKKRLTLSAGVAAGLAALLPPPAPREFRAAWVSTVANIDWPSKQQPERPAAGRGARHPRPRQGAEPERHRAAGAPERRRDLSIRAGAVVGIPDRRPGPRAGQPWYDPLKFWVDAGACARAGTACLVQSLPRPPRDAKSPLAPNHIGNTNPDAVKTYGRFCGWTRARNPPRRRPLDVVIDVVRRYDIDGVHIDDYFYPYPIDTPNAAGPEGVALDRQGGKQELDFPDQPSWQRYLLGGGKLDRPWRRQNVNT